MLYQQHDAQPGAAEDGQGQQHGPQGIQQIIDLRVIGDVNQAEGLGIQRFCDVCHLADKAGDAPTDAA